MPKLEQTVWLSGLCLRSIRLLDQNFNEWFRALKLVVHIEKIQDVFKTALPPRPVGVGDAPVDPQALAEWTSKYDRHNEVAYLMLGSMTPRLYQQFKHKTPLEMYNELYQMYGKPSGVELQELIYLFHTCKQGDETLISDHFLLMKCYLDQLASLNYTFDDKIAIGFIMESLTSDFHGFVQNYNMQSMGKTLSKKKPHGKAKGKGKAKGGQYSYPSKTKKPQPQKKEHPTKEGQCHHCKEGFRGAKKLKRGSLYLYVGNGMRAEVEVIGRFDLHLPNGLIIVLDNCHYAPTITRGVVSVFRLVNKVFSHCFTDYGLSVSMNNIIYFNAITVNDVYEIDMRDSTLPIVNSMYSVSNKKAKSSLDSSYLWHCRLAHIDKKRITKLQKDGILKSTDNEPYDKCKSCISGKMTKKPFSHKTEKVNDVLGLIHTDDCGPLRHVKSPYIKTAHRVSGLMLASYTGIRHLFAKCLSQYSLLRKRQAFLDKYKSFPMFADNDLSEFDESKDLIDSLVDEYKACESPDYIKWGVEDPDHNLTDEGNAVGMVDPTLQFT
nr:tubulin gamma-1 chain-like [Tanacetum cinerariifolium]